MGGRGRSSQGEGGSAVQLVGGRVSPAGGGGQSSRGVGQSAGGVSRGGGSVSQGGWVSRGGGGSGQSAGGGFRVGSAKLGQQNEYSLHGGRYASCVHAGGLSCLKLFPLQYITQDQNLISLLDI